MDFNRAAIPVHTVPEHQDPILAGGGRCQKHDHLLKDLLQSEEFQQLNIENEELYQNISELTGFDAKHVDLGTFSGLYSSITIYKGFNLSLPSWTDYYWPEITSLAAKNFQLSTYTTDMARLRVGPFFNYFFNFVNATMYQEPFEDQNLHHVPKFLVLSAHDTTVADFTNTLGIYPDAVPEFASTVICEIKSRGDDLSDLYLNVYFRNSTGLSALTIKGCDFDCNIADFTDIISPIIITAEEQQEECKEHPDF